MVAITTTSIINPTHTQATLATAIKNLFSAAGFSAPITDTISGSDYLIVYRLEFDQTKTYGTAFLRIKITSALAVTQQLFTNWVTGATAGTNGGTESTATTFAINQVIEARTFVRENEFRFIAMSQGAAYGLFGYVRPETRHPTFDENTAAFIFQSNNNWLTTNPFLTWNCTALTPYSGTGNTAFTSNLSNASMANANPVNNKRDLIAGMLLYASTAQGVAAKSSADIVSVAASGANRFDPIQVTAASEEYTLLFPSNGGMAIRTI